MESKPKGNDNMIPDQDRGIALRSLRVRYGFGYEQVAKLLHSAGLLQSTDTNQIHDWEKNKNCPIPAELIEKAFKDNTPKFEQQNRILGMTLSAAIEFCKLSEGDIIKEMRASGANLNIFNLRSMIAGRTEVQLEVRSFLEDRIKKIMKEIGQNIF